MPLKYGSPEHWLIYAKSDLALASSERAQNVLFETLCYHAQQAVEKALKAVLIQHHIQVPYTHDLGRLISILHSNQIQLFDPIEEIIELSKYSTIGRYPLDLEPVTENNYKHAVQLADKVVTVVEHYIQNKSSE